MLLWQPSHTQVFKNFSFRLVLCSSLCIFSIPLKLRTHLIYDLTYAMNLNFCTTLKYLSEKQLEIAKVENLGQRPCQKKGDMSQNYKKS